MMTSGVPWPLAYGSFVVGMGLVGWATYAALKHFENRRAKGSMKSG
jgi:magnesium transporter